jgi:hypothetical protein
MAASLQDVGLQANFARSEKGLDALDGMGIVRPVDEHDGSRDPGELRPQAVSVTSGLEIRPHAPIDRELTGQLLRLPVQRFEDVAFRQERGQFGEQPILLRSRRLFQPSRKLLLPQPSAAVRKFAPLSAAHAVANFRTKSCTRIIDLLVLLIRRKSRSALAANGAGLPAGSTSLRGQAFQPLRFAHGRTLGVEGRRPDQDQRPHLVRPTGGKEQGEDSAPG